MLSVEQLNFIRESNQIEGILREPTEAEIEEFARFMIQEQLTLGDVQQFVSVYQPEAVLRDQPGLNVRVGNYFPPLGDITIRTRLEDILTDVNFCVKESTHTERNAYALHQRYESLHPFTDCNGRSGRMVWMWMMREAPLGFLHTWYYQSLSAGI